jgi:hypothetical protein
MLNVKGKNGSHEIEALCVYTCKLYGLMGTCCLHDNDS